MYRMDKEFGEKKEASVDGGETKVFSWKNMSSPISRAEEVSLCLQIKLDHVKDVSSNFFLFPFALFHPPILSSSSSPSACLDSAS